MPETTVQDLQTEVQNIAPDTKETAVASLGKPERIPIQLSPIDTQINGGANATTDAQTGVEDGLDGKETATKTDATPAPAFTEEQLTAFFKDKGIEYEGIDKLKEKFNNKPTSTEETPEQKAEHAKAREKKLVDMFVANGGTVEQYVGIKAVAEADLSELSINALKKELKEAKFSDEEIEGIIKERYYQISDEDLEQYDDETDREFAKRKKEYGANKLANRSLHTKTQAQGILAKLNEEIESEDLLRKEEVAISSKIDEDFKSMPRKLNIEIGGENGKTIPPIEYDVDESDLTEVRLMLKDPVKRNNILFNNDGSLNITKLSSILVENKLLKSQLKTVYHEGGSRQVAELEKVFPARTAQELGVGGSPNRDIGKKGQPASYGKTQRINHQQHT